jgi:hypothetical protein
LQGKPECKKLRYGALEYLDQMEEMFQDVIVDGAHPIFLDKTMLMKKKQKNLKMNQKMILPKILQKNFRAMTAAL